MHPLETLLARRRQREAQVRPATVTSAVGDGTGDYFCQFVETGETVRAAVLASGTTFAVGRPVQLHRPDDGTIASNTGWTITDFRFLGNYGTGYAFPSSGQAANSGYAVKYINPSQVVKPLPAGIPDDVYTDAVAIYGAGLFTASIQTGGDFPRVSVASGSITTDTYRTLTLTVFGSGRFGSKGLANLIVGSTTFQAIFAIT